VERLSDFQSRFLQELAAIKKADEKPSAAPAANAPSDIERIGNMIADAIKESRPKGDADSLGLIAEAIIKAAESMASVRQPITVNAPAPKLPEFPAFSKFPAVPAPIVNVTNEVVPDRGGEWEIRMSTPRGESVMRVKRVK